MREKGQATTDASSVAGYLDYASSYHPSGTKQSAGTALDRLVELHRKAAVRDLVTRLRMLAGEDLGEEPSPWIEKYRKR